MQQNSVALGNNPIAVSRTVPVENAEDKDASLGKFFVIHTHCIFHVRSPALLGRTAKFD